MLKEKPPAGFWAKRTPPRPSDGVLLVVDAGVAAAVPRGVPNERPPALAAGAL